jgi:hypothetical protein
VPYRNFLEIPPSLAVASEASPDSVGQGTDLSVPQMPENQCGFIY